MCVAVPGKIIRRGEIAASSIPATMQIGDHTHEVNLILVPEAAVGDFVIAHSGFAIRRISSAEVDAIHGLLESAGPSHT